MLSFRLAEIMRLSFEEWLPPCTPAILSLSKEGLDDGVHVVHAHADADGHASAADVRRKCIFFAAASCYYN